jgi:putative FmdB family regulatory protein
MPLYQYRCSKCKRVFEVRQTYGEKPLARCHVCKDDTLKRVIFIPQIAFRGSGFYVTDNKKENKK